MQKILNKIIKKIGKIYLKKKALEETRSPELIARISKGSLLNFYGNTHSQIGQDGILQEIFKKLDIEINIKKLKQNCFASSNILFKAAWECI